MKKYAMFFAALSAAVMISSCAKEQPVEPEEILSENGLVPMTFTASAENASSKAVLNSDGKTVEWEGSESISVFDDVNDTNHKFDAETSGENTSFTGEVNSSSSSFVAVYPYNAGIVYDSGATNPISYEIPRIQEATLGSFDPKAAVFVSTSDDISKKFTFKAAFALLKVNVDVDDVVAVYAENTGANMSGSVKIGTDGTIEDGTEDMFKYVCLKNSDDSPLSTGTYYIVVRYLDADPLSSFSLTYVKSDAAFKTRVKSSDIDALSRKAILDLGSLSGIPGSEEVSWYKYYQAFLDVKIGGKNFNRKIAGDATLVAPGSAKQIPLSNGVNFLKPGTHVNTNMQLSTGNVAIMSNEPANRAILKPQKTWVMLNFAMSYVDIDLADQTGAAMFSNNSVSIDRDAEFFNMSHCTVSVPADNNKVKVFYATNSTAKVYSVKRFDIQHCVFVTPGVSSKDASVNLLNTLISINSSHAKAHEIKKLVFSNNLFYCTSGGYLAQVFNYSGSESSGTESDWEFDVELNNNVLYNVAYSSGYVRNKWIASLNIENNVFCIPDNFDVGGDPKIYNMVTDPTSKPSGTVKNNIVIGTPGDSKVWKLTNNAARTVTNAEALSVLTEAVVFSSVNLSTGIFTMAPGYESYGPQAL